MERLTIEKTELERKVDIASREEIALATRIEEMQAECDFAREQLMAVKRESGIVLVDVPQSESELYR